MDINWFNVDYDNFSNTINEVKEFIDNYDNRIDYNIKYDTIIDNYSGEVYKEKLK